MLRKILFLLFLFIGAANLSAQHIFFCEENTTTGQPIGHKIRWDVVGSEQVVYVLLTAGDEPIQGPIVYMFIDKSDDGQYYPFDSKAIKFEKEKQFLVYRYEFKESGNYSIYFQNAKQEEIAQEYVEIRLSSDAYRYNKTENPVYYEGSNVIFCQVVIDGTPINKRTVQSLSVHGSMCYIYINNFRPLNTTKFLVYFYRKDPSEFEYNDLVEIKKYKVEPTWEDAFFRYPFTQTGDYKVIIYNENELIMGNGYLSVVK